MEEWFNNIVKFLMNAHLCQERLLLLLLLLLLERIAQSSSLVRLGVIVKTCLLGKALVATGHCARVRSQLQTFDLDLDSAFASL